MSHRTEAEGQEAKESVLARIREALTTAGKWEFEEVDAEPNSEQFNGHTIIRLEVWSQWAK